MNPELIQINRDAWQETVHSFHDYNYRQLWDFGDACAKRVGATNEHVALRNNGRLLALADVRVKKIPFLRTGIAYINGGPLTRKKEDTDPDSLKICLQWLIKEYVKDRKMILRVCPALSDSSWNQIQSRIYEQLGFIDGSKTQPYRTIVLDIDRPLDDLRKELKQKWRNGLNKAEKQPCTVTGGKDKQLFEEFCNLFNQMIHRKQFDVDLKPPFYFDVQKKMPPVDQFIISMAYSDGHPIAGHVSSMLGDTCVYLLGATNDIGLSLNASYLLQWHTIQIARENHCRRYDLGGIDPDKNSGVYKFKKGLGGDEITAPGPFEYYPNRWAKSMVALGEKIYRLRRKAR